MKENVFYKCIETGSLYSWARVYNLRIKPDAQKETQEVAKLINDIIEPLYPNSWKALTSINHDQYVSKDNIKKLMESNPNITVEELLQNI